MNDESALLQQTDAKNQATTFVYDLLGRVTQRTDNVGLPSQEIAGRIGADE